MADNYFKKISSQAEVEYDQYVAELREMIRDRVRTFKQLAERAESNLEEMKSEVGYEPTIYVARLQKILENMGTKKENMPKVPMVLRGVLQSMKAKKKKK